MATVAEKREPKKCPRCDTELEVLLFMGIEPDGFVCPKCKVYLDENLKSLAIII